MKGNLKTRVDLSKKMILGASLAFLATGTVGAVETMTPSIHSEIVSSVLQEKVLTGQIVDVNGEPIIGANVLVKGTTYGTITDLDGKFTLNVPETCTIQVSFIGYVSQNIKVGAATKEISVKLKEDTETLEEVVVVGYGTQKKVNLSGSLSTINVGEMAESRPITNVSHALAGMAAGVNVRSSSNQPGNDNATIQVRGQGTLNNSSPLVIIDGAEAGINTVNPNDIESMTVLKDAASSAIYGSRAANGVILITTKQGKSGKVKVDYTGYVSFESAVIPNSMQPVSNYADYMEYINLGYKNSNQNEPFTQGVIDEWRADGGKDPLRYPNTNWLEETFRNATAQNHSVSLSGGSDKIRFYSSFGYQNTPGVMENAGFEKLNGRLNVSSDVRKWLTLGMQLSGYVSNLDPAAGGVVEDVFTYASATTPGMVFRAPDGRYGNMNNSEDAAQSGQNNPLRRLNSACGKTRKTNMRTRFLGTLKPFKGFTITGSYSYEFVDVDAKNKSKFIDTWNFKDDEVTYGKGRSKINNSDEKIERFFNDVTARYENRFFDDRFGLNAMVGASQEKYQQHKFSAGKYDMIDTSLGVINGAVGDATASGSSTVWAMRSYFGRINLDWQNKYLLELNLRADQSSRFLKGNRTGYFPSGSFAWRLDQEQFMSRLTEKGLSNLKLRVSYGSLGNNAVGNYDALATYANANSSYSLNNLLVMGLVQNKIANAALSWESTYMANVGIDFGFFKNRFTGTIDYFHKKTKDILINLPAPTVHGTASIPKQNSATVINQGVELTLGWQDKVGDFSYGINGNFTFLKNVVDKFKGEEKSISGTNLIWEGHPINTQYMLRFDRIIQTPEDLALVEKMEANNPEAFKAFGKPGLGDMLYKDVDGNGIINMDDRDIVNDGPIAKFQFGLNLNASWKGLDFAMLLQGQAGCKGYFQHQLCNEATVRIGYQLNKEVVEGSWVEGRTDASFPRLTAHGTQLNIQKSDFYLQNLSYVKIRNIQLGYTLPKSWSSKASMERVRIFGSLENFFTFTSFKGLDPETRNMSYPSMKDVVLGVNVTF